MQAKKIYIFVFILVVSSGVAFFAGMQYQKSQIPSARNFQNMRGQFGQGTRAQISGMPLQGQGRPVSGEIIGKDEKSITVKLADGSSRIVFVGETIEINQMTLVAKDDLVEGVQVFVTGIENSDGSITANSIQISKPSD